MHGSTAQHLGPPGRIPGRPETEAWPKKKNSQLPRNPATVVSVSGQNAWDISLIHQISSPKTGRWKKTHVVFHNAELLIPQELEPSTWNPEHCNSKQLIWRGPSWLEGKDCPTTTPGKKNTWNPTMEVWFRWFSGFQFGGFLVSCWRTEGCFIIVVCRCGTWVLEWCLNHPGLDFNQQQPEDQWFVQRSL